MNRREFIALAAAVPLISVNTQRQRELSVFMDGRKLSDHHPVSQLVSSVPDYAFDFLKACGSTYLLKARNGFGQPVSLHPISPQFVKNRKKGFRVQAKYFGAGPWDVPADDMIELVLGEGFLKQDLLFAYSVALTNGLKKDFGDSLVISAKETA